MSSFPTRVCKELASKSILQIACGSSHTLFLTDTVSAITNTISSITYINMYL